MRAIKKPIFDVKEVYLTCVNAISDSDLKNRLLLVEQKIITDSIDYDIKAKNLDLYQIKIFKGNKTDTVIGNISKEEFTKLYSEHMVASSKPARKYYDLLKSSTLYGKCPCCGFGHVKTLDHYLPKSKFPTLSVLPTNLIPVCRDCNSGEKKTAIATKAEDQTLHPYYDHNHFINTQWLFAKVLETIPATIEFYVEPPDDWSNIDKKRIKAHFVGFNLATRYSVEAGEELSSIKYQLCNLGTKELVFQHLDDRFKAEKNLYNNSWKTAMYLGLASSEWYITGGFKF